MLVPAWDGLPSLTWREKIAYLTVKFLELPQIECPVQHIFEDGLYIREMHIPAGTLFLGRAHLKGHEVRLLSGSVIHVQPDGTKAMLSPPFKTMTVPGYHAVFYAVTDIVGRTYHLNPGNRTNIEELENEAFELLENLKILGNQLVRRLSCQE